MLWGPARLCTSLFCCALLCGLSSFPIILTRKRELVALLCLPEILRLLVSVLWLSFQGADEITNIVWGMSDIPHIWGKYNEVDACSNPRSKKNRAQLSLPI